MSCCFQHLTACLRITAADPKSLQGFSFRKVAFRIDFGYQSSGLGGHHLLLWKPDVGLHLVFMANLCMFINIGV